jgi:hypothetical protein
MKICFPLYDGVGGVLLRNGYVNFLSKNNDEIILITFEYHKSIVNYMFKHLKNIKFEYIPYMYSPEEEEIKKESDNDDIISIYLDKYKRIYPDFIFREEDWGKNCKEYFPKVWIDIPTKINWFEIYKNEQQEDKLYNDIVSKYGSKYILYQDCKKEEEFNKIMSKTKTIDNKIYHYNDSHKQLNASAFKEFRKDLTIHEKYINNNKDISYINLHNISKHLTDTSKLLENSLELHLVPGPYPLFIKFMIDKNKNFLKNTKIYIHEYVRPYYVFKKFMMSDRFIILKKK